MTRYQLVLATVVLVGVAVVALVRFGDPFASDEVELGGTTARDGLRALGDTLPFVGIARCPVALPNGTSGRIADGAPGYERVEVVDGAIEVLVTAPSGSTQVDFTGYDPTSLAWDGVSPGGTGACTLGELFVERIRVTGVVRNPHGGPIPNATVGGCLSPDAVTDAAGAYQLDAELDRCPLAVTWSPRPNVQVTTAISPIATLVRGQDNVVDLTPVPSTVRVYDTSVEPPTVTIYTLYSMAPVACSYDYDHTPDWSQPFVGFWVATVNHATPDSFTTLYDLAMALSAPDAVVELSTQAGQCTLY